MIRNFMNWDLRNDGKNVQDVRGKINKSIVNVFSLFMTIMLLSMAAPAGNLQAASTQRRQVQVAKTGSQKASSKAISAVMMNAYKKYLRKNVRSKKYYAIVNIGNNNAPVLLIGTQGAGRDKTGRHYTGCKIYYYKKDKVVKMDTFKDGVRWLLISKRDGQNYLTNGGSDFSVQICIKNGNIYRYQYYNNHNWMKNYENKWAASIVKKNGKVIKNIGYLDGKLYRKYTSYYTYLKKSEVIFIRNAK